MTASPPHPLDALFARIASRKGSDPETSYTARLFAGGPPLIARKLGEEAVETIIEALARDDAGKAGAGGDAAGAGGGAGKVAGGGAGAELASESADLLYHLLVLWAAAGLTPEDVWRELDARTSLSGLEEKARRATKQASSRDDKQAKTGKD